MAMAMYSVHTPTHIRIEETSEQESKHRTSKEKKSIRKRTSNNDIQPTAEITERKSRTHTHQSVHTKKFRIM